ncbi:nitroreductase family protein [Sandaracinobacter sp. RS1-74]|uniref:nitroreductase family protein n=1 Tax=Sandaracinobacteroides sayramensis TaxID=2913411 RepID=UPI001EDAC95D|nr:nitroreductase family protein [Sandaracinobacteroides sayramensis]MCG2840320.1 nitroreductase family protein [Sandaracinobacteroides sayramensis]
MDPVDFNDRSTPLSLLLSRRSGKARDLIAPGPDPAQLQQILSAASRVPDHGKLAPWRFVVIEDRDAFSALLARLYKAGRPEAGRLELEAMDGFARQSPTLVALISTLQDSHIPAWEQELSAGAAAQNLLLAAHAMGYVGNWLTGAPAFLPGLAGELGAPGGRIAGFFFIGTPTKALEERPRPALADIVSRWPG